MLFILFLSETNKQLLNISLKYIEFLVMQFSHQNLLIKYFFAIYFLGFISTLALAKPSFQQQTDYNIKVFLDTEKRSLDGQMRLIFYNNSADTLDKIYFHLYWNAFQYNSPMAYRAQYVDTKNKSMLKIKDLSEKDQGSMKINQIQVNSKFAKVVVYGSIAEVSLAQPILPRSKNYIDLNFYAKIPPLLRRAGYSLDSEKTEFSIAQWYPKLVQYDDAGWHPIFYVAREFYGIFGDFHLSINSPKSYIVAAGASLDSVSNSSDTSRKIWHFSTHNTHDIMWAADKDFHYFSDTIPNYGIRLNFYYKTKDSTQIRSWINLHEKILHSYPLMDSLFGNYPYPEYTFIQGGDGGMEYQMGTLIRDANYSTAVHEWFHSWFQGILANNEARYAWLDEGFTSYATSRIVAQLYPDEQQKKSRLANISYYNYYYKFLKQKNNHEEPMVTLADFYEKDQAYTIGSYIKGSIFLSQLGYIVGDNLRDKIIKTYKTKYQFQHPDPDDFIALAEKISGIQLKWYLNFWINTTKTINYNIKHKKNKIIITRKGQIPMPIDLVVYYDNGEKEIHYIPLDLMLGKKVENEYPGSYTIIHDDWIWTNPKYEFELKTNGRKVKKIVIDPSLRLADIDRKDNQL